MLLNKVSVRRSRDVHLPTHHMSPTVAQLFWLPTALVVYCSCRCRCSCRPLLPTSSCRPPDPSPTVTHYGSCCSPFPSTMFLVVHCRPLFLSPVVLAAYCSCRPLSSSRPLLSLTVIPCSPLFQDICLPMYITLSVNKTTRSVTFKNPMSFLYNLSVSPSSVPTLHNPTHNCTSSAILVQP